jgi:hypothetical protein
MAAETKADSATKAASNIARLDLPFAGSAFLDVIVSPGVGFTCSMVDLSADC